MILSINLMSKDLYLRKISNNIFMIFILCFLTIDVLVGNEDNDDELLLEAKYKLGEMDIHYSVEELRTIPWLKFNDIDLSEKNLEFLLVLKNLEKLDLQNTNIDNSALHHLKQLPAIKVLWLQGTNIDDGGITILASIETLEELHLPNNISESSIEYLEEVLHNIVIEQERTQEEGKAIVIGIIILIIIAAAIFIFVFKKAKHIKEKGSRIVFIVSIYFFIIFIILLINAIHFISIAVYADGRVVELVLKQLGSGDNASITYHPSILYTASDGRQYTFISGMGSYPASYEEGEPVKVMYDPANPDEAEIHSKGGVFTVFSYPLVFLIFALIISSSTGGLKPFYRRVKRILSPKPSK